MVQIWFGTLLTVQFTVKNVEVKIRDLRHERTSNLAE